MRNGISIGIDPYDYVRREHAARRSWKSQEQKALVLGKLVEGSAEYLEAQAKIQEEADRARSEAAQKQHKVSNPRIGESKPILVAPQIDVRLDEDKQTTQRSNYTICRLASERGQGPEPQALHPGFGFRVYGKRCR
jgi:hypothetical protein